MRFGNLGKKRMSLAGKNKFAGASNQGSPALKTALTAMSSNKSGVRTLNIGRNTSGGFKKSKGM